MIEINKLANIAKGMRSVMLTKQCFIDTYSVEEMNVRTLDENFKFSAGSTI